MLHDSQGLYITTHSTAAIAAINQFIDQSLGYGNQAESAILSAIAADPTCVIAQAYAAAYYLTQENALDRQRAMPFLRQAQRHAAAATEREQRYIEAIAAWAQSSIQTAIALHESIAQHHPTDLLSIQQGQYHYFYLGQHQSLLRLAELAYNANPDQLYLRGMLAFGLVQCGQLAEAEAIARQAVALNYDDPWAHHAIAHVMETQQRVQEGIAWMETAADTWEQCNSMLYTHNWWHVALFYLAHGEVSTVFQLYEQRVWGRARQDSPKDQVGAIATLLRLELRGVDVGNRWQAIANQLYPRLHEHALPFHDLHYIYALVRAERLPWLDLMMQSMDAYVRSLHPQARQTWTDLALPIAHGLIAHAQGRYEAAIAYLKPVLSTLWQIGGSDAQRMLFKQIYHDARIRQRLEKITDVAQSQRVS